MTEEIEKLRRPLSLNGIVVAIVDEIRLLFEQSGSLRTKRRLGHHAGKQSQRHHGGPDQRISPVIQT